MRYALALLVLLVWIQTDVAHTQAPSCEEQRDGVVQYADILARSRNTLEAQLADARADILKLKSQLEVLKKAQEKLIEEKKP